jgi:hypothetical protein
MPSSPAFENQIANFLTQAANLLTISATNILCCYAIAVNLRYIPIPTNTEFVVV